MTEIREKCAGCGKCCRAIWVPLKHEEFDIEAMEKNRHREPIQYEEKVSETMSDTTFVSQNWYPLTKEEALERNPFLKMWDYVDEEMLTNNYYGCSQLDNETGLCRTHDNLPKVCSGYPWYGGRPDITHQFYTDDCFYKRDITQESLDEYDRKQQQKIEKVHESIYLDKEVEQ